MQNYVLIKRCIFDKLDGTGIEQKSDILFKEGAQCGDGLQDWWWN